MTWRRVFPGRLDQVARARSWTAMLLADTSRAEDAELILTELVSNALLHTRSGEPGGWFGVEITLGRHARIAVHDLGGRPTPQLVCTAPESDDVLAEHGHGLRVVQDLAALVGVNGSPASGHTVWALLALEPSPALQAT
jgi:anti-sigma regulatory factor (Ser/Thr protein kinase)